MNAWLSLAYPLSVRDPERLGWLRSKMDAVIHLQDTNQPVDFAFAKRLAFTRWLIQSGRLSEGKVQA